MGIGSKSLNLAYFELLGDAGLCNRQAELYREVTIEDIQSVARQLFNENNCSILRYKAKNKYAEQNSFTRNTASRST